MLVIPRPAESAVVVDPAGPGPGNWAGAPSALIAGAETWLAYRERDPQRRGGRVVLGRVGDGTFDAVLALDQDRFGAASLERPALTRTPGGRWRLYVSCATPGSKHWRIDLLEAAGPGALGTAPARTVFGGDERTGVKDPVIRPAKDGWHAWICCHPLEEPGQEDRMVTRYATSSDGVEWTWHGPALAPRPGTWDARGARVTAVLPEGAYYDGRATAEENFRERTGLAAPAPAGAGRLRALDDGPVADVRYVDAVREPDGALRLFYEAPRPDGSHALHAERRP